ncbi:MAG: ABC transporter permease [Bacillota bacterium]
MGIIIKFIFQNIREKKFRTFLILFSVSLSAGLFFASHALTGTIENTFMQRVRKYFGTAEIMIEANQKSPSWFFRIEKAEEYWDRLEYAVGSIETGGTYKTKSESVGIDLKGFYLDDLQRLNPFILAEEKELLPFSGAKIILSEKTARRYALKTGQTIEILIGEAKHRFRVVAIARAAGHFQDDSQSNTAVVPRSTLARMFYAPGDVVSKAYLKPKDPSMIEALIKDLSKDYRRYTVREPISQAELRRFTESVTTPFQIMVMLVLVMSIFIIYSSFRVITRERLPVIGTFRSIGATRRTTDLVLLAESILYGVIGGLLGCCLGIGILYVMATFTTPEWMAGSATTIKFSIGHLLSAFVLAVILPLAGSFLPIAGISKIPVKDVILNTMERPKRKRTSRLFAGLISLCFALIAPRYAPKELALVIDVLSMIAVTTAAVALVPFLTAGFLKVFERLYICLLGNEGVLAAKNLRENRSILNNISLLVIGISSLLMINTVSFSVIKEVANFYRDSAFEVWLWMGWFPGKADRQFEGVLRAVKGVKDTYGVYSTNFVELEGYQDKINLIDGINPNRHPEFWNLNIEGGPAALRRLNSDQRNILLSYILRDKLGVKKGDFLTLKMNRGKRSYRVAGFFNSLMWGGSYALIADRYFKLDTNVRRYATIFIKTSRDPDIVVANIKKKFARFRPWINTTRQMSREEVQSEQQMFLVLQGFSVMTLIIGTFGVFNNLIISFIERQRFLAMMRSLGMSRRQMIKMIFIEAATGGMIGGFLGILAGTILISLMPFLMKAINQIAPIHYSLREYLVAFTAGVVITVAASVSPALKTSRMNIIEAIKYE